MRRHKRAFAVFFLGALFVGRAFGAVAEPPAWEAPESTTPGAPYLGQVNGLLMSEDGGSVVIVYQAGGIPGSGVVVIDGHSGSVRRVVAFPDEWVGAAALTLDGTRLLTLRHCMKRAGCAIPPERFVETALDAPVADRTVAAATGLGLYSVKAMAYDATAAGRVLVLTAADAQLPPEMDPLTPAFPLRLTAFAKDQPPVVIKEWQSSDPEFKSIHLAGISRLSLSGDLTLITIRERQVDWQAVEVKLHPDISRSLVTLPRGGEASFPVVLSSNGRRALYVGSANDWRGEHQDIVLVDRTAGPEGAPRQITRIRAAFPYGRWPAGIASMALSSDGRSAAVLAYPLEGDDPHTILQLLDLDTGDERSVDLVSTAGIGNTLFRARFTPDDLLRRLKALHVDRWVKSPAVVGSTLGMRFTSAGPHEDGSEYFEGKGELSPYGSGASISTGRKRSDGSVSAALRIDLTGAGPCLTPQNVKRFFGEDFDPDAMEPVWSGGLYVQKRAGLSYKEVDGRRAIFGFRHQHCARDVMLTVPD